MHHSGEFGAFFAAVMFMACVQLSGHWNKGAPPISLSVVAQLLCSAIAFSWIWLVSLVTKKTEPSWDPMASFGSAWRFTLAALLLSCNRVSAAISSAHLPQDEPLAGWTLDVWDAQIPLCAALIVGFSGRDLAGACAISLAMTCGVVLLLPFSSFDAGWVAHVCGIVRLVSAAGCISLVDRLLNDVNFSPSPRLAHMQIVANISALAPLFSFMAAGMLELGDLAEYLGSTDASEVFSRCMAYGVTTFALLAVTSYLLYKAPLLLVAVISATAASMGALYDTALAGSLGLNTLLGCIVVFLALSAHVLSLYTPIFAFLPAKVEPSYKILDLEDSDACSVQIVLPEAPRYELPPDLMPTEGITWIEDTDGAHRAKFSVKRQILADLEQFMLSVRIQRS